MSYENVYIHAIDGTDCYVPIVGEFIKTKFYKLQPSKNYSPDDVTFLWSFRPGDIVKVEELSLGDGKLKRLAIQQKKPEKELDYNGFLYYIFVDKIVVNSYNKQKFQPQLLRLFSDLESEIWHYPKIKTVAAEFLSLTNL
ncbi:hypothetical protein ACO1KB_21135 [Leptospira interrogans serovar Szwajizak]|uniref:hypothetical protein n=1 Tax=Leptospira interrogans TaxID=173 RepID=UPI00034A0C11|nr:hypothetical protein [Leptospira interrogans]